MILVPVLLGTLLLEELIYRLGRGQVLISADLAGDTVEKTEGDAGRFVGVLSWIRMGQLFLFGLLFAVVAASSGVGLMDVPAGQISGLLLLVQVVRIVNRKVINNWAVLGMTVILQCLLLVLLLLTGIDPGEHLTGGEFPGGWLMSIASFGVFFLLTVTVPFCSTYYLRLVSREGSSFYSYMPSLIYSEYWTRRLTRVTAGLALALLLVMAFAAVGYGYPMVPALVTLTMVLLLYMALALFRNRMKLHHPGGIALVSLAWLIRLGWVLLAAFSSFDARIG